MAKLKPKFHSLLIIYLAFGSIILGCMYYAFDYAYGQEAIEDFLKVQRSSINDVVTDISSLSTAEQVYPHAGGLKKLTTGQGITIPLYTETPENADKIERNDSIVKVENSREIIIFSQTNRMTLILADIVSLRQQNQLKSGLTWLLAFAVIGFCVSLNHLDRNEITCPNIYY